MRRSLLLVMFLLAGSTSADEGPGIGANVIPVRQLEVGYLVGEGALKVRVSLSTGEAIDFTTKNPEEIHTVLQLGELLSSGRVEMTATVENKRVRSLQCAIRGGSGG